MFTAKYFGKAFFPLPRDWISDAQGNVWVVNIRATNYNVGQLVSCIDRFDFRVFETVERYLNGKVDGTNIEASLSNLPPIVWYPYRRMFTIDNIWMNSVGEPVDAFPCAFALSLHFAQKNTHVVEYPLLYKYFEWRETRENGLYDFIIDKSFPKGESQYLARIANFEQVTKPSRISELVDEIEYAEDDSIFNIAIRNEMEGCSDSSYMWLRHKIRRGYIENIWSLLCECNVTIRTSCGTSISNIRRRLAGPLYTVSPHYLVFPHLTKRHAWALLFAGILNARG